MEQECQAVVGQAQAGVEAVLVRMAEEQTAVVVGILGNLEAVGRSAEVVVVAVVGILVLAAAAVVLACQESRSAVQRLLQGLAGVVEAYSAVEELEVAVQERAVVAEVAVWVSSPAQPRYYSRPAVVGREPVAVVGCTPVQPVVRVGGIQRSRSPSPGQPSAG